MSDQTYFPSNRREALALIYIQSQDLSQKSPEDIVVMYKDAYDKISQKFTDLR